MHDSTSTAGTDLAPGRWHPIDRLPPQEAAEFARNAQITRHAQREYMGAHIVLEATANEQIRHLVERFLQVGRLARDPVGKVVRARSPKADGDHPYSFLLDLETRHIVGYRGPSTSWFDEARAPLEDLLHNITEQRQREEAQRQRREAHEERMRVQQEAAAARRTAVQPAWPLLPDGHYDRNGKPAPAPVPRRPITDEARIRRVGRLPHVVFHSDALNSPFFREVPVESRCEALHRVLDVLLRAPRKGTVMIGSSVITVTGKRVTMTLTPDCSTVRTLNPPKPGNHNEPPLYRTKNWAKERDRKPAAGQEP